MAAAAGTKKELYSRFVEIGRVVLIAYGPEAGKLATVVDVVDHTSVSLQVSGTFAPPRCFYDRLIKFPTTRHGPYQMQALIDGPAAITGVKRQVINLKWLQLTDLKAVGTVEEDGKQKHVGIHRNARQKSLVAAWKSLDILAKWNKSSWGRKLAAKAAKAASSDLDRFKARKAHQKIAKLVAARVKA